MNVTDIYPNLKIVPIDKCLRHEGIVEKWVDRIAFSIMDIGLVKNPMIAAREGDNYVIIDGMHRLAAYHNLEVPDVLICEIDYFSDKIRLEGWDAFTFRPLSALRLLQDLFPEKSGYAINDCHDLDKARRELQDRQHILIAGDKGGKFYTLNRPMKDNEYLLDELIHDTEKIDDEIDRRDLRVLYVENTTSTEQFEHSDAQSMIIRPHFRKSEVIERTLSKKLFPRKSTRHLIPDRPLRVDLDLSLLRAQVDIETKNRLLDEHLKWCFESGRVRFYPESVYVFSD